MILAHTVPPFATRGLSGCTDEDGLVAKVGTSKKGSTISLLAAVHLGCMIQAQLKRRRRPHMHLYSPPYMPHALPISFLIP